MIMIKPDEPRNQLFCISGTMVRLYLNVYQLYQVLTMYPPRANVDVIIRINIFSGFFIYYYYYESFLLSLLCATICQYLYLVYVILIFIIMKPEENQDEFKFQQMQKSIKQKMFECFKNYLQHCQSINPIFIYFLILIESLQILWFSIHPLLDFLDQQFLLDYIRATLAYLNFQNSLQRNNNLLLPFVLLSSSLILFHITSLVLSVRSISTQRKQNQFSNLINKTVAVQIVVLNTVLALPIFNVSIITLYCDPGSYYYDDSQRQCYDSTHIVLCFLSAINLLVLIGWSLAYWFLFYTRNPFSKSYYGLSNNLFRLGKIVIKFLPPIYFIIQFKYKFQNVYIFMLLFLVLAYIAFFRINSIHNFYQNFFYFELYMESIILWFCINTAICYQMPSSGMNFVQSCLCSVLFAYTVCLAEAALTKKFLISNIDSNIKKQDRQKFIYMLVNILFKQTSSQQINPIVYIKLLNSSLNICSIKISRYLHKNDLKTEQILEVTRQLMLLVLTRYFEESPSINLQIVKCHILFDTGLKILALHEISELRSEKISIYEQFMLYNFKATHHIFQQNQLKNSEDNISQINTYLQFVEYMNQFQMELEACAKNNEQFWEQLCQDMPSTNKVFHLAKRSMKYSAKIQQTFRKIQAIFPENLSSLMLYFQFLNHVCVCYKQFNKIKQKWQVEMEKQKKKQGIDLQNKDGKIKFRANDKMCVLQISTNSASIGTIVNCNSEVKKYLGYDRTQLLNQKVTKIMPKIYSQIHDNFIRQYLKKADSIKLPVQKTVFAFKKNLRIIQTCLAVKIFPNIMVGFQLVGFFKEKNVSQNYLNIMVNMKTLQIEGMTQGFIQMVGNRIKLVEIQKQPLKLSHVFPQIEPNHNFKMGEQIKTLLRFSDCTDKLIDLDEASSQSRKKFQKLIILQLESIKYYSEIEIGVFSLKYPDQPLLSLQDTNNSNLKITQGKISQAKIKGSQKGKMISYQKTKDRKIFLDGISRQEASIQRKIQDFILSKSHLTQICILKIVFFVFFLALTLTSIFISLYQSVLTKDYVNLFEEIELSKQIIVYEGKILILNKCVAVQPPDSAVWQIDRDQYINVLKLLQKSVTSLFEKANDRKNDHLVINEYQRYNFKTIFRNTSVAEDVNLYYLDGLLQAVFIGLDFLKKNSTCFRPLQHQINQSMYFIQQNMKDMLPSLSIKTTEAYRELFSRNLNKQLSNEIYFVSAKAITFLIIFMLTYVLLKKFSKFNRTLIKIFNNILKWDAYQLYSKCYKFRYKSFENHHSSTAQQIPRNSDLLKVFPKSLLIKLSQGLINRKNKQNNSQQKTSIFNRIIRKKDQNATENQEDEKQKLNSKSLQMEPILNKGDLINISIQNGFNKKFFLIFLLLLILVCVNFSFLLFKKDFTQEIFTSRDDIINLGTFSKSFLFTHFYGYKMANGLTQNYEKLYKQQLQIFYNTSKTVSNIIGDPENYLRKVYKNIQLLNAIVNNRIMGLNQTSKQQLLEQIEDNLFQIQQQLRKLSELRYMSALKNLEESQKVTTFIKISLQIILTVIFCRLVNLYLLKKVQNNLQHSCNMMKMIPIWVITKSRNIKNIVLKNNSHLRSINTNIDKDPEDSAADFLAKDKI